jgi:hypothetical protein
MGSTRRVASTGVSGELLALRGTPTDCFCLR